MDFSVKIGRLFGIEIRLHWTLLAMWAFLLCVPWPTSSFELIVRAGMVLALFISILLHEFGHSLAGRFCDGHSDRILMWALGGLAYVRLPNSPVAHFLTALAGPLVTLCIWAGLSFAGALTNVWSSDWGMGGLAHAVITATAGLNLMLLLFNLIPAFPLDGGQMLHAVLWRGFGRARAMWFCVHVAMVAALLLVIFAAFTSNANRPNYILTAVAAFIFFTAWRERQTLSFEGQSGEYWQGRPGVPWNHPYRELDERQERIATKQKKFLAKLPGLRRQEPSVSTDEEMDTEEYISKEVDPILDKISKQGIHSLTARERRVLEKARQRMEKKSK